MKIAVLTHNPEGKWGDVRPLLESKGFYKGWNKSINVELGQTVLIYISSSVRQIQYVMQVEAIHQNTIDLKLQKKLPQEKSQLLSFEKLRENGLKNGTVNYILDHNARLYDYVNNVLNGAFKKGSPMLQIKNIILYGAPGVGKTHNYKNLISMIEEGREQKEIFDTISSNPYIESQNDTFENIKEEKRVEFVTFHQSYSYEDFIEGFRPQENSNIELEDGIFKQVAERANNSIEEKEYQHISFEDAYNIFREKYNDGILDEIKTVSNASIYIREFKDKSIKAQTENAKDIQYIKKSDLEVVVKGVLNDEVSKPADVKTLDVKKDTHSLAGYYFPFARNIVEIMKQNKIDKKVQKNYYIIIDEINRGNISKIFGELITLIEEDKRDRLEVTLPYSKTKFKVPSNLYIIATMNSTDKSIATIDIALRRRFTFLKMKPNPSLVTNQEAKEFMEKLNIYIKEKLGEDYMLGHSYFMGEDIDLDFIKEYKIKPLLEEYFYAEEKSAETIIEEALHVKDNN